ncbi:hypothetical protein SBBP2_1320013 [Burkholderiales bacterium]|nr:hypothetical protein SBBP2_1320013 [Burkholderiales bacterium]
MGRPRRGAKQQIRPIVGLRSPARMIVSQFEILILSKRLHANPPATLPLADLSVVRGPPWLPKDSWQSV